MPYSPTTWTAGSTPLSAGNMNNIESGISNSVYKDGSVTMTAALPISQALSGSNKAFLDMNATDGKHYQLIIRTDGKIVFYNVTDSKTVFEISSDASGLQSNGNTVWISTNNTGSKLTVSNTAPSSPATGDIWIDTSVSLG